MPNSNINLDDLEKYSELYRVIKLVTGETLFATLVNEDSQSITFEYPILVEFVKTVSQSTIQHNLSTTIYCPFTEDRTFTIGINQIQHLNFMNPLMVRSYLNLAYEQNKIDLTVPLNTTIH